MPLRRAHGLALLLLACHGALALLASRHVGVTTDEPVGITGGFELLTRREMRIHFEHPPFLKALAAVPLLGLHPPIDGDDPLYRQGAEWRYASRFMFECGVPVDALLRRARIVPMIFGVMLGAAVYVVSLRIHGPAGGLLSLAFYAFDPAFLGLSPIVQFDVGLALFTFTSCIAFRSAVAGGSTRRFVLAGALLGLGVATKFTAVYVIPLWGLLALVERRVGRRTVWGGLAALAAACAVLVACYLVVLVPDFVRGFAWQLTHAREGHVTYLWGEITSHGRLLYFPVVFLLKTPIETLGALLLVPIAARTLPRDPRRRACAACALGFFLLMLPSSINIGHRYLLPVYPFLMVLLGALARARVLAVLPALLAVRSVIAFPDYMGFTNELAGPRPELHIADSNLDMGQDLPRLAAYLAARGRPPVHLFYMGMDRPAARGISFLPVPCERRPGLYAVSVNVAMGLYPRRARPCVAWLRDETPIDRIGTSILVYDIRDDRPATGGASP